MSGSLSPNTQVILLLTAPLIVGRGKSAGEEPLTASEYKRLVARLRELNKEPADLLERDWDLFEALRDVTSGAHLERLLGRGFLLAQAVERWSQRGIWVISRADAAYPRRLKQRLQENAPAILYGCGNASIVESYALAVVGSRNVDETTAAYAAHLGELAAQGGVAIVSGGARGVDEAAMVGALRAGGKAIGVLANGLDRAVVRRDYRDAILAGRLLLLSPYDPSASFVVGHAMQRNKLIYALGHAGLVVASDKGKGGTWSGAIEQLESLRFGPVYVRSTGESSPGLEALKERGALPWPNPTDGASLRELLRRKEEKPAPTTKKPVQPELPLLAKATESYPESQPVPIVDVREPSHREAAAMSPADELFAKVRELVLVLLTSPKTETAIAKELGVKKTQASDWLKRLLEDEVLEKKKKGRTYHYALPERQAPPKASNDS